MDCRNFQTELPEMILNLNVPPGPAATAHMKVCPPCTKDYLTLRKTFGLLDHWIAPEPTSYFDQKLAVRLREEQAAPRMGFFERLHTTFLLGTRHTFRPLMAGTVALMLIIGGGSFAGHSIFLARHPAPASATVNDLQILDHNEQAFQQMDELQQEEDNGSRNEEDGLQSAPPVS